MEIITEIAINDDGWHQYDKITPAFFNKIIKAVIKKHNFLQKIENFELSVMLTNNAEITGLNNEFRGKNAPTNVLSFPEYENMLHKMVDFQTMSNYIYLGDMAFALEKVKQEAIEKNINFLDHLTHLALHSILHLIGYDHIDDEDAELMENLEIEILKSFNINSPY